MWIYSVVQDDYEAPIVHCSFASKEEAERAKSFLEKNWPDFKRAHEKGSNCTDDDDGFAQWLAYMEVWEGFMYSYSANDEFSVVEQEIYETMEDWL